MPDISDQNIEAFVVEPVTQLDGSPVSTSGRMKVAGFRQKLERPGIIALAEGLALAVCFSLPWFSFPFAVPANQRGVFLSTTNQYSGWDTAIGLPEGPNYRFAIFAHLWLIPVTAVALLVVAWLYWHRRVTARLVLGSVLALSVLALLIAAGFYWQIASLNVISSGDRGPQYIVLWGCWVAMCVNVVAGAACIYLLRPGIFSFQRDGQAEGLDG
jgi:hypothetical protein